MKIGTIENNAHNTLEAFLQAAAKDASALDWASAFITNSGLNSVLYLLTAAAKKGKARVLTGLYQGFTEPAALRTLLRAQAASKGRLEVRLSKDRHFHWKAYFVFGKQNVRVVVGSSNLTSDGLATSGEFNLMLSVAKGSPEVKRTHGLFEKHWHHDSTPLTKPIVDAYTKWRKDCHVVNQNRNVPLKAILGKQFPKTLPIAESTFYRASVESSVSDATVDLLAKTTNWGKKNYDYFNDAKSFKIGDRVVLFDFNSNRIKVVEVTDTTRTPVKTPDGLYFAAHKRVRSIPSRKWSTLRHSSLKRAKLIRSKADAEEEKKLTGKKYDAFVANLKKTV